MGAARRLHTLILCIVCISQTVATTCPYNTQECGCTRTMICRNLQSLPQLQTGSNITAVSAVVFQGGNITSVPGNSLPPGLERVEFYNLPLTNISENAFQTSATTLYELSVQSAAFAGLPNALLQLTNLTVLEISDTMIAVWDEAILQRVGTNLRTLRLQNVNLTSWPTWILFFRSLNKIDFSQNPIKYLSDNAFTSVGDTLEELDLQNTGLTQLPPTGKLSRLAVLHVFNNHITNITSERLSPTLIELGLYNNSITEITDASFPVNSSITLLSLDSNPISTISFLAFKNLRQITDLSLSFTNLTEIPLAVTSLTNLNTLSMITETPFPCICPLRRELVQWYETYNGDLHLIGSCIDNGDYRDLDRILNGEFCNTTFDISTSSTDINKTPTAATTSGNKSPSIGSHVSYGLLCCLLILAVCHYPVKEQF